MSEVSILELELQNDEKQPTVASPIEPVVMCASDLTRVAKNFKLDIKHLFEQYGGFWIVEYDDGRTDFIRSAPCGWEGFKNAFYYEDIENEQKRLDT